jgi:hypothetical protein
LRNAGVLVTLQAREIQAHRGTVINVAAAM